MEFQGLGRLLITFGVLLALAGVVLVMADKIPLLGRLPGDLTFRKGGWTLFAPIGTMLLLSLALTIVLNLALRLFR